MHLSALHSKRDWAFLALRLIIAAIFLYHGYQKWGIWSASTPMTGAMLVIMRTLAIAEPLAGLALIAGLWTQIASIGLTLVMISAIYTKITIFGVGFGGPGGWELDLAVLGGVLVLLTQGAGRFSLDGMMSRKK